MTNRTPREMAELVQGTLEDLYVWEGTPANGVADVRKLVEAIFIAIEYDQECPPLRPTHEETQ